MWNYRTRWRFSIVVCVVMAGAGACVASEPQLDEVASEVNVPPAQGRYQIINFNSGRCLDVTGISQANGAPLQLWDCAAAVQLNQLWLTTPLGSWYQFVSANSPPGTSKSMDVDLVPGTFARGARFQQWDFAGTYNQIFSLRSAIIPGQFQIIAYHSGLCMETVGAGTGNGTRIQQNDCNPQEPLHQLWSFAAR